MEHNQPNLQKPTPGQRPNQVALMPQPVVSGKWQSRLYLARLSSCYIASGCTYFCLAVSAFEEY